MTDIDELLRQTGDAWVPPQAPPPDLDGVLSRGRARRMRTLTATTAAVVVLVGGGVLWSTWPGAGIPAVPGPVPAPQGTEPAGSPTGSPATTSPEVAELTRVARELATGLARGRTPVTAQAVLTSRGQAGADEQGPSLSPGDPVWLVQLRGVFVCDSCPRPQGALAPVGTVVERVVDLANPESGSFSLGRQPTDLAKLGQVVTLELGELPVTPLPVPDPDLVDVTGIVRHLLVDIQTEYVSGAAVVSTTLGAAQQVLFHHTPSPPPPQQVWFVEVQGLPFTCPDCTRLGKVKKGEGGVVTLVIDKQTGEPLLKTIADKVTDFTDLAAGEPQQIDQHELSTATDWQPQFASYPRSDKLGVGDGALLEGRLLVVGGCLVVETDGGPLALPVLPTPVTVWSPLDRTLTVGSSTAQVGDRVSWGGGYSTTPVEGGTVPESCAGLAQEYFRVDSA